jgi:hypothetical protein
VLIDAHVHLNDYHRHDGAQPPTKRQVAALWAKMEERGVDHAVVITSYKVDADRPSVEDVLEVLAGDGRATVVEGLRWRGEERTDVEALERRIRAGTVKGIKLYPGYEPFAPTDPDLADVYGVAARHSVPVLIHTGDTYAKGAKLKHAHPLVVDEVAVDYSDVDFVMCHAGNPWFVDAAEVLYKNDNVYADISGLVLGEFSDEFEVYTRRRLREMIGYMGAADRKLMYGSDWPLVRMGPYVDFLERLELSDEARECVAWRTAAHLFRIPPVPAAAPADGA